MIRSCRRGGQSSMLTLYSYPELFGVADNNPFGLKVFAFLKLTGAGVPARAYLRCQGGAARPASLYRRRRRACRRQRHHHRPSHRQISPADRQRPDAGPAQHRPDDPAHARRSLLGDVLFALEGPAILAAVPRCDARRACEPDRRRHGGGPEVQFPALPLSRHRPLRAGGRLQARHRGPRRRWPA